MSKSFNNLRVGKRFELVNYGESFQFEVIDIMNNGDCKLKDLNTLELYSLSDLVNLGQGNDFEINEF